MSFLLAFHRRDEKTPHCGVVKSRRVRDHTGEKKKEKNIHDNTEKKVQLKLKSSRSFADKQQHCYLKFLNNKYYE